MDIYKYKYSKSPLLFSREKFSPGPGFESEYPALRADALPLVPPDESAEGVTFLLFDIRFDDTNGNAPARKAGNSGSNSDLAEK